MAQTNKPDLVLCVPCQQDSARTWALDPQGRDSFRIVVRCRRAQDLPKPRPWFIHFGAIVHALLSVFALWRPGN